MAVMASHSQVTKPGVPCMASFPNMLSTAQLSQTSTTQLKMCLCTTVSDCLVYYILVIFITITTLVTLVAVTYVLCTRQLHKTIAELPSFRWACCGHLGCNSVPCSLLRGLHLPCGFDYFLRTTWFMLFSLGTYGKWRRPVFPMDTACLPCSVYPFPASRAHLRWAGLCPWSPLPRFTYHVSPLVLVYCFLDLL